MRIGIDGILTDFERLQLEYETKYMLKKNMVIAKPKGYNTKIIFGISKTIASWYDVYFQINKLLKRKK